MFTCPFRFQIRYCPLLNADRLRVSSTPPPTASRTSILCILSLLVPQSRQYSPTWCQFPSVRLISMSKLVGEYQVDAIRSVFAPFCSARTSVVELVQVKLLWLFNVTCA